MRGLRPPTLRLRAEAEADYAIVAACLQDALMPMSEMTFLPGEKRFVAVFDRFMWEHCGPEGCEGQPPFLVQSALRIEGVAGVRQSGIDQADKRALLELLTLTLDDDGALLLTFAGGGAIRLAGKGMVCLLEDLGEPRPTGLAPRHDKQPASGAESGS